MDRLKSDELAAKDAEIKYLKKEIARLSAKPPDIQVLQSPQEISTLTAATVAIIYSICFAICLICTKSELAAGVLAVSVVYIFIKYKKL